jgi:hypothetical protein
MPDDEQRGERREHSVSTVPPPAGEHDIYDAKTQVGGLTPEALALLRQLKDEADAPARSKEEAQVPVFEEEEVPRSAGKFKAARPAAGEPPAREVARVAELDKAIRASITNPVVPRPPAVPRELEPVAPSPAASSPARRPAVDAPAAPGGTEPVAEQYLPVFGAPPGGSEPADGRAPAPARAPGAVHPGFLLLAIVVALSMAAVLFLLLPGAPRATESPSLRAAPPPGTAPSAPPAAR